VHFDDRISSLSECTPNMFIAVFEAMLGVRVPGVDREPRDLATHEANMQALLDFMGEQLIGASLDHISARGICQVPTPRGAAHRARRFCARARTSTRLRTNRLG
jgi:hypothetical protein